MVTPNNKYPLVYLVTPVHNGRKHTDRFLQSLQGQTYPNFKVIIVDDGSTDGTAQMIREKYPNTILLHGNGHLWWSGGTNKGVRYALTHAGDYVLTINNDLHVGKNYIMTLVAIAQKNPEALIGSLVVYINNPNNVWYAGATFDKKTAEMRHVTGKRTQFTTPTRESEWLTGMGVLIPVKVFDNIGFYDATQFPQYFGDADFSSRAKLNGFQLLVSTNSIVWSDVESAWIFKQLAHPTLRMFTDLFTSIRSPFNVSTRIRFYRLYWGRHWRRSILKLYFWTMKGWYWKFIVAYAKKIVRIGSHKTLHHN